jgi:SAM-dependent methyltransferase
MSDNFQLYSAYYDLLYRDKDYAAEAAYIDSLLKKFSPGASSLVELGCGTGNHAEHLCAKGYSVTGLERSADMVELALQKNIKGFNPVVKDITHFELPEEFDAAISLFHVISYLTGNEALLSCFRSVHRHLKPGGLFIFDIWYSPAVYAQKPETRIKRLENDTVKVTRLAEPVMHINRNVIDVNYEIIMRDSATQQTEIFRETHPMRHFSIPEIALLANQTGFELAGHEEFLTGHTSGSDTWGVCLILKKIQNA